MSFYVGTSGFSYKEWKGYFYPEKMKDKEMLSFYAQYLTAVEINNSFYRMPKRDVLTSWADSTPDTFKFIIKASRRITHFKRLKDAEEPMSFLMRNVEVLKDRLGAVLFQLPPNMRCNMDRLTAFLKLVPVDTPISFEFRNESWFNNEVYDCLRSRNIPICHADSEGDGLPFVATADWGYLRLRQPKYDKRVLNKWLSRISDAGWNDSLVFFKHEDEGAGPKLARKFMDLAATQKTA